LLMPEDMLIRRMRSRGGFDPYDQDEVRNLAEEFQVSTQAILIRLSVLGLVTAGQDSPW
jgi:Zn-dependent peptidase ImmA (M78 family)